MNDSSEPFINSLLGQMTIEEKIGQLNQAHSQGWHDTEMIRQGMVGSLLNASGALTGQGSSVSIGAEITNVLQQAALETHLKIPLIFGRDVIHGYRTVFPIPLAQAAAFNLDLTRNAASVSAQEATASGIKMDLCPHAGHHP